MMAALDIATLPTLETPVGLFGAVTNPGSIEAASLFDVIVTYVLIVHD